MLNLRHSERVVYQKTEGKATQIKISGCSQWELSIIAREEFGHGCAFVFGAEPGLCCCLSEQMTSLFKPSFTFCNMGTGKPCTGPCGATLVPAAHGSHDSPTCMGAGLCAQSRGANQTDQQPAPEESGLVTVDIAFPKHLPDSTQGQSLMFA